MQNRSRRHQISTWIVRSVYTGSDRSAKSEYGGIMAPGNNVARKGKKPLVIGSVIALVVGLAGGTGLGLAVADPTDSKQYIEQSELLQATETELVEVKGNIDEREANVKTRGEELDVRSGELDSRSSDLDKREKSVEAESAAVLEREKTVGLVEEEQKAKSIGDGVYTVGTDIEPGTYRAKEEVETNCFWGITKDGTNGENYIAAGNPLGGRPTVVVKKGQVLHLSYCGTFVRQ